MQRADNSAENENRTNEKNDIKGIILRILKKLFIGILVLIFWILVWEIVYRQVDKPLVIPSPLSVWKTLLELIKTSSFWEITLSSVLRILLGYFIGVGLGVVLAVLTSVSKVLYAIFSPMVSVARATPVASLTLIIIMWVTNKQVPLVIVSLMVFPVIWGNTFEGIKSTDKKLLEMSKCSKVPFLRQVLHVYLPAVYPHFVSGAASALGLAWKSGIAAEILGATKGSMGQQLNDAKVYLDTEGKFAWTVAAVVLSMIFERLFTFLLKKTALRIPVKEKKEKKPSVKQKAESLEKFTLYAENISKRFGKKQVLRDVSLRLKKGEVVALRGVSGAGKTTLLRILASLEKADGGKIRKNSEISYLFQENRLLPELTAKENILYVNPSADAEKLLSLMELEGCENMYPSELSGGMKRRLAIARALSIESDIVFLDEPFVGLDEELKERISGRVFEKLSEKSVILVTHDSKESEKYSHHTLTI